MTGMAPAMPFYSFFDLVPLGGEKLSKEQQLTVVECKKYHKAIVHVDVGERNYHMHTLE